MRTEQAAQTMYLIGMHEPYDRSYALEQFTTLGSSVDNTIILPHPQIASRHARIERKGNVHIIRDMRTDGGTHVNGVRVFEAELKSMDQVRVGSFEFRYTTHPPTQEERDILQSKNVSWNAQLKQLPNMARADLPVLILGPSGSGKEKIAALIHAHSLRAHGPFVAVNCSALTESLIESELFGHTKGSFTGASHDRKGAFETARGGTIFLDEIGDLPLSLQPKLLRALENQEIRPLGSDRTITTDVRIISATQQSLLEKINSNEFRMDLFFRLGVLRFSTPSLRSRSEDFEDLLYHFCKLYRVRFSQAAINIFKAHNWPGNIRELKNSVARAAAQYPDTTILPQHVPYLIDHLSEATANIPNLAGTIREIEYNAIINALVANNGNQRRTANALGIPKSTLHDRLKTYEINIEELIQLRAPKRNF